MLDALRDAVIARRIQDLRADLSQAGASLQALSNDLGSLETVDPKAAWELIHGLQASLIVAERSLRSVRRSDGLPQGTLRKSVNDLLNAVAHMRQLLERDLIPYAEKAYGFPPPGTRWQLTEPGGEGT